MSDGMQAATDGLAIGSTICGAVALLTEPFGCCCFVGHFVGFPLGIAAVVCGIFSLRRIKNEPGRYTGQGLAITGLSLGGVALLIGVASVILLAVGFAMDDGSNPFSDWKP